MSDLPDPIQRLDDIFAAATVAHEYIADTHRELIELHADDAESRRLLTESATVILEQMPGLSRGLRRLATDWSEQEVLDPQRAADTLERFSTTLAEVEPALEALGVLQRQIAAKLTDRLRLAGSSCCSHAHARGRRLLVTFSERELGGADTPDLLAIGLCAKLLCTRAQLLGALAARAQPVFHRSGQPAILIAHMRPLDLGHRSSLARGNFGLAAVQPAAGDSITVGARLTFSLSCAGCEGRLPPTNLARSPTTRPLANARCAPTAA